MSVRTTFDDRIQQVYDKVDEASKELVDIVYSELWGFDELGQESQDELEELAVSLRKIRKALRKYV